MSKIALSGNASGTGTLTIASPNTNTDYTLSLPTATTTLVGTDATQTLTNKTIDGSQLVAASVTSTQMATAVQPLGVGQTWQDLTASRSAGTTYTNSTGRPIYVSVTQNQGNSASATLTVSGIIVSYLANKNTNNTNGLGMTVCAIVPAGATYVYNQTASTISVWGELR